MEKTKQTVGQVIFNQVAKEIYSTLAPQGFTEEARVSVALRNRRLSENEIIDVTKIVQSGMNQFRLAIVQKLNTELSRTQAERHKQNILLQLKQANWWTRFWYADEIISIREALVALDSQYYSFEKAISYLNS